MAMLISRVQRFEGKLGLLRKASSVFLVSDTMRIQSWDPTILGADKSEALSAPIGAINQRL